MKAHSLRHAGHIVRYCQRCRKFHDLDAFDTDLHSCRDQRELHNRLRRERYRVQGSGNDNKVTLECSGDTGLRPATLAGSAGLLAQGPLAQQAEISEQERDQTGVVSRLSESNSAVALSDIFRFTSAGILDLGSAELSLPEESLLDNELGLMAEIDIVNWLDGNWPEAGSGGRAPEPAGGRTETESDSTMLPGENACQGSGHTQADADAILIEHLYEAVTGANACGLLPESTTSFIKCHDTTPALIPAGLRESVVTSMCSLGNLVASPEGYVWPGCTVLTIEALFLSCSAGGGGHMAPGASVLADALKVCAETSGLGRVDVTVMDLASAQSAVPRLRPIALDCAQPAVLAWRLEVDNDLSEPVGRFHGRWLLSRMLRSELVEAHASCASNGVPGMPQGELHFGASGEEGVLLVHAPGEVPPHLSVPRPLLLTHNVGIAAELNEIAHRLDRAPPVAALAASALLDLMDRMVVAIGHALRPDCSAELRTAVADSAQLLGLVCTEVHIRALIAAAASDDRQRAPIGFARPRAAVASVTAFIGASGNDAMLAAVDAGDPTLVAELLLRTSNRTLRRAQAAAASAVRTVYAQDGVISSADATAAASRLLAGLRSGKDTDENSLLTGTETLCLALLSAEVRRRRVLAANEVTFIRWLSEQNKYCGALTTISMLGAFIFDAFGVYVFLRTGGLTALRTSAAEITMAGHPAERPLMDLLSDKQILHAYMAMVALWAPARAAIRALLLISAWYPPLRPWFVLHAQEIAAAYHIVRILLMSGSIPWVAWCFFSRPIGMVASMRFALKSTISTLYAIAPLGGVPLPCMRYALPILVINALLPAVELLVHWTGLPEIGLFWLMPPEAVAANAAASAAGLLMQNWFERRERARYEAWRLLQAASSVNGEERGGSAKIVASENKKNL